MSYRVLNNNRIYILQAEVDGAFPVEKNLNFGKIKFCLAKLLPWVSSTKLISLKLTKIKSALKIVDQFSRMGRLLSVATPNLTLSYSHIHLYLCGSRKKRY